jgi:hypothetical protein
MIAYLDDSIEGSSPLLSSPGDGLTHCEMYSALGSNYTADTSRDIRDRKPWTRDRTVLTLVD